MSAKKLKRLEWWMWCHCRRHVVRHVSIYGNGQCFHAQKKVLLLKPGPNFRGQGGISLLINKMVNDVISPKKFGYIPPTVLPLLAEFTEQAVFRLYWQLALICCDLCRSRCPWPSSFDLVREHSWLLGTCIWLWLPLHCDCRTYTRTPAPFLCLCSATECYRILPATVRDNWHSINTW